MPIIFNENLTVQYFNAKICETACGLFLYSAENFKIFS